jgi:dimethylhistidine N-methyltransferase
MNTWIARPLPDLSSSSAEFLRDVRAGLCRTGQKSLPPKYLYDELGSMLFDAITRLPEYAVYRGERRLLEAHADDIANACPAGLVVELGSGSSEKTRFVLEALLDGRRIVYRPIEISPTALEAASRALADLKGLSVRGVARDYLGGLDEVMARREPGVPALVMFLGSSLGNFDALASFRFLQHVRRAMHAGDLLLLGTDLDKPEVRLQAAYDDALGVTAAFNRNLLVRMNRELRAEFPLDAFRHRVRVDRTRHTVGMYLEAERDLVVPVRGGHFDVAFRAGESIHTENSHKYSLAEIDDLMHSAGFECRERWLDDEALFASGLYAPI